MRKSSRDFGSFARRRLLEALFSDVLIVSINRILCLNIVIPEQPWKAEGCGS